MKVFMCPRCNSKNVYTDTSADEVGLYCHDCGNWIKWLSKNEVKAARKQEEKMRAQIKNSMHSGKEFI